MISIILVYRIRSAEFSDLWDLTSKSINGLIETADEDFELIVVDNGSWSPEYATSLDMSSKVWADMPHFSRRMMGFRQLRFDDHVSLAKAWNEGVNQADGDYIMPVNNDIVYHEAGWMSRLIEPFGWSDEERHQRYIELPVGIVGIQHMSWGPFGGFTEGSLFVFQKAFVEQFNLNDDEEGPVRLFDEQFTFTCEDVDFNHRVKESGYHTMQVDNPALQPRWLQHLGHRTIHTLTGSDENVVDLTHENRRRLCEKWGVPVQVEDR